MKYFTGPTKPKTKLKKRSKTVKTGTSNKKSITKSAPKPTRYVPDRTDSDANDNETGFEDEDIDELESSDDELEAPPKKKQKKAHEEDDSLEIEATTYIFIVIPPPPTAHIRGKGAKPPPEQHLKRPPFLFNIDLLYDEFLMQVASATPCYPEALTGMMWKFEKPIKGDMRPLTTETSYTAMIKQLHDKNKDHVINIYMPPPNKLDNKPTFVRCIYSDLIIDNQLISHIGMGYR